MTERGRPPALSTVRYQARLQAAFLRHYDRDEEVGRALLALVPVAEAADITHGSPYWQTHAGLWNLASRSWERHPPERRPPRIIEITEFVRAAERFADAVGLDRLGGAGRAYIVAWCDRYLRARTSGSAHPSLYGPAALSTAPVSFTFEPDVAGVISPPWEREFWDLTRESRRNARSRLERIARAHIHAQLDRVELDAKAAGLTFPDTAPQLQRDLDWLFRKVRHKESFQAIYDSLEPPPRGGVDTVRKAVLRIAKRVGVDTSGWETGWR